MKRNRILLIISVVLMFTLISSVSADSFNISEKDCTNLSIDNISNYSSDSSKNFNVKKDNTIISGKIINCENPLPFKGATVHVKSLSGEVLATGVSNENGNYKTSFYSLDKVFNVVATYHGHVYPNEIVSVSDSREIRYGIANLRFGTLNLSKGSTDILSFYPNKFDEGPDKFILQIKIKNNALSIATDVWANFNWLSSNNHIQLAPGELSSKYIGNISPGETIDVFFLISLNSLVGEGENQEYIVTVNGTNTGSIDNITGNFITRRANSQERNEIESIIVSDYNPGVGTLISLTVKSSTSSRFDWVNLPIMYDPSILKLVKVNTSYGSSSITNIFIPNPGTNEFITLWVFEVIGVGSNTFIPWILDSSGNSYHFNMPTLNLTIDTIKITDLQLIKTVDNNNPLLNSQVSFLITVTNHGPSSATNVSLIDRLDTSTMEFISYSSSKGFYCPMTGIWKIGNMSVGSTETLTIVVKIKALGEIFNIASVSGNEKDPDTTNNNDSVRLFSRESPNQIADLRVTKVVNNQFPLTGETIVYTITVVNNGPRDAINVQLTDILPDSLILVLAVTSIGTYDLISGIWTIGNLANGQRENLILTCIVDGTGYITNEATVMSDTKDPKKVNNYAKVTIEVLKNDIKEFVLLASSKEVNVSRIILGDSVEFTITVTNIGKLTAFNVSVIDILPQGLILLSFTPSIGYYDPIDGIWTIGDLAIKESATLKMITKAISVGEFTNIAITFLNKSEYSKNQVSILVTDGTSFEREVGDGFGRNDSNSLKSEVSTNSIIIEREIQSNSPFQNKNIPVSSRFQKRNITNNTEDPVLDDEAIDDIEDIAIVEITEDAINKANAANSKVNNINVSMKNTGLAIALLIFALLNVFIFGFRIKN